VATSTTIVNEGTQRKDNWQLAPLLTFLGFSIFIVYATFRAFQNDWFMVPGTQYLSPMYSPYMPDVLEFLGIRIPQLEKMTAHGGLGWILSPALLILWAPAGFRSTCYYYRKAYYRSFFGSPSACAVGPKAGNPLFDIESGTLGRLLGMGKKYTGERSFPLVLQNLHRYFFYVAALFILILSYDAFASFFLPGYAGLRVALGSFVFTVNVVLLALYTFGCHSWRHLLGGKTDCWSSCGMVGEARHHAWQRQSILNEHHMLFAWLSLFTVGFADLYVFLVSKGIWTDPVFFQMTWQQIFG
jgi:hypothetical protein